MPVPFALRPSFPSLFARVGLLTIFFSWPLMAPVARAETNGVLREVYSNIAGGALSDLTNNPAFPSSPSLESLQPEFEAPSNWAENYGTRMSAYLVPPVTGNYTFWIASDDASGLFLSTNAVTTNRRWICGVQAWTSPREWTKESGQKSALIPLVAGQRYYIEALQKEGGGGDNLCVRWQLPNGTIEEPIPNQRLIAFGLTAPIISQQPVNLSIVEGGTASFTVKLQRYLGAACQWRHAGTNLPNATNFTCSFGPAALRDSLTTFDCVIVNPQGTATSSSATLTVLPDITRPVIQAVANYGDPTAISVVFSELVDPVTATQPSNYTINNQPTVSSVRLGADGRSVILTTSPMNLDVLNVVRISNVLDRAQTPNAITPNSAAAIPTTIRPFDAALLRPGFEPPGPSSRRHGVVISEIMYHPAAQPDGRDLQFVEIYNAQPWFQDLSGWRLSGDVDLHFPTNTVLPARSYLVVAASPTDFAAAYPAVSRVLGPFEAGGKLPHGSGTLRLRNAQDAVLFEVSYQDAPPWPVAADGAGHSLVLARPSYGERDVQAWAASDLVGGSPGAGDSAGTNLFRSVFINEILAHTDEPQVDYIELFNYSLTSVNLEGCVLTDDPATNRFVLHNVTLGPRGFVVYTSTELGFALSAAGETVYLKNPAGNRIIDVVRFGSQENGVALGRFPDGAPAWTRLQRPTPGTANASMRLADVVLNEVMAAPLSGDAHDEYVELFNRSGHDADLSGWRLSEAVRFTMPTGTVLKAGSFLVVGGDAARLRARYSQLNSLNTLGNFSGSLANGGERLVLSMPDTIVSTNQQGQLETNLIHIAVSECSWKGGGRWPAWANGGGSSLELVDAHADLRTAGAWAASDETAKSPWVTVESTAVMDNGYADATQLHVTLLGAGEALLDNVEVIPQGGANLVSNGTFESGAGGWTAQGNHNRSSWEQGEGFQSSSSLHLRAAGRGDTGANRVRVNLTSTPAAGTTVTLRAKARWLKGNPNLLLRLRGNWQEAPANILAAANLGSPGLPNSRAASNQGPSIGEVRHWPILPAAGVSVTVTAQINDPDGLSLGLLHYRVDPSTNDNVLVLTNAGAGYYVANLPAQNPGTTVAFYVEAVDHAPNPAASRFPADAPNHECIVRWGDPANPGSLGTYRMWITQTNVDRWIGEELMSNNPKDITFVYGTNRVIYNAGAMFHGSPYHSPAYNSPLGNSCDYDLVFPEDDRLLGETDINLFRPGNGGGDGTAQAEMQGYWLGSELGIPFLYCRPVFVYANGQRREEVFLDAQQPNGDFVRQWHPDDTGGDLHKVQLGFEFGDRATGADEAGYAVVGADLSRYTTTGGAFKQARYRQTLARRSAAMNEFNDYTNIFNLVNVVQTNAAVGTEAYTLALQTSVDVEEWFKVHVVQHLFNNYDSFSFGGGQNAFIYKPERDRWKLYLWDIDFAFGGPANEPNLFGIGGREHGPVNSHPPFERLYWQTLLDAVNGPFNPARANNILNARYSGMLGSGANVANPQGIKDFIAARRTYILSVISSNTYPFSILSNGGTDFSTNRNLATLTGTAPLELRTLLVNGEPLPAVWTTVSNWTVRVPLQPGLNTLALGGLDSHGNVLATVAKTIRVNFTGIAEPPERVVLNEIHYHPPVPDTSFVELFNAATNTAFDLSGWRLDGAGYTFPSGTIVEAGQFLVVAADATRFTETFGVMSNLVGAFHGTLANSGETLRLLRPSGDSTNELVVQEVRYDNQPPWPGGADGLGPSLQLIDASQPNSRVGNWSAAQVETNAGPQTLVNYTQTWRYNQTGQFANTRWTAADFSDDAWPAGPGLLYVENADLPGPKSTPLTLGRMTYYFRTKFVFNGNPGSVSLVLNTILDDGAVIYLNGQELTRIRLPAGTITYDTASAGTVGDAVVEGPYLLPSTALLSGTNTLALEVHQSAIGSSDIVMGLSLVTSPGNTLPVTPGAPNSVRASLAALPPVWLNEIQPRNLGRVLDNAGQADPWVELLNNGTNSMDLSGWSLLDPNSPGAAWTFPAGCTLAPGQFRLVWLDGETAQHTPASWHAGLRVDPIAGTLVLARPQGDTRQTIDYLRYVLPVPGSSYGAYPDGQATERQRFAHSTPEGPNDATLPPFPVFINEWMAANAGYLADPADGNFDDWFELYNPSTNAIDLSGCYLTDNLTQPKQFKIPAGYAIGPGSFLLVWADGDTGQNAPTNADLHVSFKLNNSGETIGLADPTGTWIDAVVFGQQTNDVSQGRSPDGGTNLVYWTHPTPRQLNVTPALPPPAITGVATQPNDTLALSWSSAPGSRYQVEFKSLLEEPEWTPLGQPVTAVENASTVLDSTQPHPQRFYRIRRLD